MGDTGRVTQSQTASSSRDRKLYCKKNGEFLDASHVLLAKITLNVHKPILRDTHSVTFNGENNFISCRKLICNTHVTIIYFLSFLVALAADVEIMIRLLISLISRIA